MKISERTVSTLARIITGDSGMSPYRSGPNLVKFFNDLGSNDVYGAGFPSRWYYCETKIRELNDTPKLPTVFDSALDPRDFLGTQFSVEAVIDHLNEYLRYDGYELVKHGNTWKIREISGALVELKAPFEATSEVGHIFIDDQIMKCDLKIFEGDYGGAITNARSLLEAVLIEVEKGLGTQVTPYDGDLTGLYRRVQGLLDLDPSRKDISNAMRQILGGLTSVVVGLATLRNKASDAHATSYMPSKGTAKLAVNAAKTVADFVLEAFIAKTGRATDK